jgi:hypothetical protein
VVKYLLVLHNPPSSPLKIRGDRGGLWGGIKAETIEEAEGFIYYKEEKEIDHLITL